LPSEAGTPFCLIGLPASFEVWAAATAAGPVLLIKTKTARLQSFNWIGVGVRPINYVQKKRIPDVPQISTMTPHITEEMITRTLESYPFSAWPQDEAELAALFNFMLEDLIASKSPKVLRSAAG
jgi:hypothetical protein